MYDATHHLSTLDSYDIIHYYSDQSSLSSSENESDYVIAPLKRFGAYQTAAGDNLSTSENVFPTLFKNATESETAVTITEERSQDLLVLGPLPYTNLEQEEGTYEVNDNVYRKVADWVQSQRPYFSHQEENDLDDIEVIDPVDLFHDSMLNDYLLLTESDSEKRVLLRHLGGHKYNIESLHEALQKYEYEFVRSPRPRECMELSVMTKKDSGDSPCRNLERCSSTDSMERAFVGLNTVLEKYYILNEEGQERCDMSSNEDDFIISTNCATAPHSPVPYFQEGWRSSIMTDVENISTLCEAADSAKHVDCQASDIATTIDMAHSVITVIHGNASDDNDSEVWEDAKDIPHWLDGEQEEVFCQVHRPLYYYRDRVKGCYRIVGVEDDTVVLFSGNDDDSIFYHGNTPPDLAGDPSESTSSSPCNDVDILSHADDIASLSESSVESLERRRDSGIEDMDEVVSEYALVSISAREAALASYGFKSGQLQTRRQQLKTVTFSTNQFKGACEFLFLIIGGLLFVMSVVVSVYILLSDASVDFVDWN